MSTAEQLLQSLIEPRPHRTTRSWSESKITTARRAHPCQLCCVQIPAGEQQLAYAQGKRSWLYMHTACARARGTFQCKALESSNQPKDQR
jgi:hypothetical protein